MHLKMVEYKMYCIFFASLPLTLIAMASLSFGLILEFRGNVGSVSA